MWNTLTTNTDTTYGTKVIHSDHLKNIPIGNISGLTDQLNSLNTNKINISSATKRFLYTIPASGNRGVRITYEDEASVYISICGHNGGRQMVLIGTGYGEHGTVRNRFTELVTPSGYYTWCLPETDSLARCIEILVGANSTGTDNVEVISSGNITFTAISALTSTKQNAPLALKSDLSSYLPLSGGTLSGTLDVNSEIYASGRIVSNKTGGMWVQARDYASLYKNSYGTGSWNPILSMKTTAGDWSLGTLTSDQQVRLVYITDANYNAGSNNITYELKFPAASGTIALTTDIPSTLPANGGTANFLGDGTTEYTVGLTNGHIPYYCNFPDAGNLVSLGYNTSDKINDDNSYFKGLCKWIGATYKNKEAILIGRCQPNSQGWCIIHKYSHENNSEGYPRYLTGTYQTYLHTYTFTIWEYNWYWNGGITATTLARNGDVSKPMTFNWYGHDGQPTWLWGGEDGTNMYVYDPKNFSVYHSTRTYNLQSTPDVDNCTLYGVSYKCGQITKGTSKNNSYSGSIADYNVWSYPTSAGTSETNGTANIMDLRFTWAKGTYYHDFFMTPNNNSLWHRSVVNSNPGSWYRIVQEDGGTYSIKVDWTNVNSKPTLFNAGGSTNKLTKFTTNTSYYISDNCSDRPDGSVYGEMLNITNNDTWGQLIIPYEAAGNFLYRGGNTNGNPNYGWRKIWDNNNLTNVSQLNNDANYVGYKYTVIDASALDENTWYPVLIKVSAYGKITRIEITNSLSQNKPSWATHESGFTCKKVWDVYGSNWGVVPNVSRTVYVSTYSWCGTDPVRGIGQLTNSANEYVYVRGGGEYEFWTSNSSVPVLITESSTFSQETIAPTTTVPDEIVRTNQLTTDNISWSRIVNRPTTLSGYGIGDSVVCVDSSTNSPDVYRTKAAMVRMFNQSGQPWAYAYGQLLSVYGGLDTFGQLYFPYSTNGNLFVRSGTTSQSPDWKLLLSENNYFNYALPLSGGKITGMLEIQADKTSWREGIRIYPYNSWSTIVLGGNDLKSSSGTTTNTWSIHNNNGNFWIAKNGSDSNASAYMGHTNQWWFNDSITTYGSLNVAGLVATQGLEFSNVGSNTGHGGYIDFHYNGSTEDFTSRIIEYGSGKLALEATNVYVGYPSTSYALNVAGDSYVSGWSRSNVGFYIEGQAVYFTHQGAYVDISMNNGDEFELGSSNGNLYFGYRAPTVGKAIAQYYWQAGSSTSWANHKMGNIVSVGTLYIASTSTLVGAVSASSTISATGTIYSSTGIYSSGYVSARGQDTSSDINLKTDFSPIKNALDYVLKTHYTQFKWKDTMQLSMGIIAQEEENRDYGYLVKSHDSVGHLTYDYAASTALLGAAIQEEDSKVEALKRRVAELENEIKKLKEYAG